MSKYTILLIDYEPRSIESLKTPLESVGYDVVVASDGITGVEQFDSLKPDLTLVEAMIPKKHGFEVCQQLKATDHGRRSPIAILTAVYKGRKYRTQALHNYKCDEYLEKPIEADQLLQTVGRLLNLDDPYRPLGEDTPSAPAVEVVQEVVPEPAEQADEETETGFETTVTPTPAAELPKPEARRERLPFDLTGADESEIMDRLDEILVEDEKPRAADAGGPPAQQTGKAAEPTPASVAAPVLPQLEELDDGQLDEALSVLDTKIDTDRPAAADAVADAPAPPAEVPAAETPPADSTPADDPVVEESAAPPEPTEGSAKAAAEESGLTESLEGLADDPAAELSEAGRRDDRATADVVAAEPPQPEPDPAPASAFEPEAKAEPATEPEPVADDGETEAEAKTGQVVDFDSHRSRKRRRGKGKKAKGRKAKKREAGAANGGAATVPAVEPARSEPSPEPAAAAPSRSEKAPSRGVPVWIWGVAALLIVGGAVGLFLLRGSGDGGSTPPTEPRAPMIASTAPGSLSSGAVPPIEAGTASPVRPTAEESTAEPAAEPESTASAPSLARPSEQPARAATKSRPKPEPPAAATPTPTRTPTPTPKKIERASTREPKPTEPRASAPSEPKRTEPKASEPPARRIEIGEPEAARQERAQPAGAETATETATESVEKADPTESAPAADAPSLPEPTLKSFSKPAVTPPATSRALPVEPKPVEPEPVDWTGKLVDIRDVDVQPRVLDRKLPDYTHRAMRLKQQGTVELRVLVDEKGRVAKVEVTKPIPNSDLNDAAADAVRRWKFSPATKEGQPVKTWKKETVTFRL